MKHLYPKYIGSTAPEVVFWTDFLVERGFVEKLRYQAYLDIEIHAAYHDPCKLGRRSNIYDSPRTILENMPGIKIVKFKDEKELAPCCGVTAFIGCDDGSLYLRHERLKEARDLGVDILVTTCPSCVSHYSCALASLQPPKDDQPVKPLKVVELGTILGTRLFHFNNK
jgi:heterodisulfide reductase subunit D